MSARVLLWDLSGPRKTGERSQWLRRVWEILKSLICNCNHTTFPPSPKGWNDIWRQQSNYKIKPRNASHISGFMVLCENGLYQSVKMRHSASVYCPEGFFPGNSCKPAALTKRQLVETESLTLNCHVDLQICGYWACTMPAAENADLFGLVWWSFPTGWCIEVKQCVLRHLARISVGERSGLSWQLS